MEIDIEALIKAIDAMNVNSYGCCNDKNSTQIVGLNPVQFRTILSQIEEVLLWQIKNK